MINNNNLSRLSNSNFLHSFEFFYYQILRLKERALNRIEKDLKANQSQENDEEIIKVVEDIQNSIRNLLDEQNHNHSKNMNVINSDIFQHVTYIMVALADEIFLNLNWKGAKTWQYSLLEGQIFQTQIAGELFFKKIDALFETKDANSYEIAQIYLMALSLGFRGQYRNHDQSNMISWYQLQLYEMCGAIKKNIYTTDSPPFLFTECYESTLKESPGKGLPDLRTFGIYALCVFATYLFVSYVVWFRIDFEIRRDLNPIFNMSSVNNKIDGHKR